MFFLGLCSNCSTQASNGALQNPYNEEIFHINSIKISLQDESFYSDSLTNQRDPQSDPYTHTHMHPHVILCTLHFEGLKKRLWCQMEPREYNDFIILSKLSAINQIITLHELHFMLFSWKFNNLSFLAPAGQVPVLAAGRRSGILLSGTGPSLAGILAGSSPPGPFPSHQLSCVEASWKNRKTHDVFFFFQPTKDNTSLM